MHSMKIALAASLIGAASAAKEYVVSPVNRDYDNGMEYCLKNGMSPGSIHSKADQAAVMAAMKLVKVNKAYAGAEETFTNGIYKWNDGSKVHRTKLARSLLPSGAVWLTHPPPSSSPHISGTISTTKTTASKTGVKRSSSSLRGVPQRRPGIGTTGARDLLVWL